MVQNSKGGGLAANFTGNTQTMGVRGTADFLEKATWTLAGIFFFLCILSVFSMPRIEHSVRSGLEDKVQNIQTTNPTSMPSLPQPTETERD